MTKAKSNTTPADLKRFRTAFALTQPALAKLLGTTAATVSRWEAGLSRIPGMLPMVLQVVESKLSEPDQNRRKTDRARGGK